MGKCRLSSLALFIPNINRSTVTSKKQQRGIEIQFVMLLLFLAVLVPALVCINRSHVDLFELNRPTLLHNMLAMLELKSEDRTGVLCNAVACPHLVRSGMGTACSRSASAHLYHAGSRLLPCDGAAD